MPPESPPHIFRLNAQGLIECVCLTTGRILQLQSTPRDLLDSAFDRLTKITTPQGDVFIERGVNFDHTRPSIPPYSKLLGDLLCQSVAEGATLKQATQTLSLEYADICRWRRENPEFKLALLQAKQDRAEYFHDDAITTARNTPDPKLKIDTYKWAAEKGDPDQYGQKTKITGDANAPVTIILDSGIRRKGDVGYQEPRDVSTDASSINAPAQGVPSLASGDPIPNDQVAGKDLAGL